MNSSKFMEQQNVLEKKKNNKGALVNQLNVQRNIPESNQNHQCDLSGKNGEGFRCLQVKALSLDNNKDIICPINNGILNNPYKDKEGHSYCKGCIEKWLEIQNSSPISGNILKREDLKADEEAALKISRIDVICNENSAGCTWSGKLSDFNYHRENECLFTKTKCKYMKCNYQERRALVYEHEKYCNYKVVFPCVFCRIPLIEEERKIHYEQKCPEKPSQCDKCKKILPRNELNRHATTCYKNQDNYNKQLPAFKEETKLVDTKHNPAARNENLQSALEAERSKVSQLSKENSEQLKEIKVLTSKLLDTEQKLNTSKSDCSKLKQTLDETSKAFSETKCLLRTVQNENQDLLSEITPLRKRILSLENFIRNSDRNILELREKLAKLANAIQGRTKESTPGSFLCFDEMDKDRPDKDQLVIERNRCYDLEINGRHCISKINDYTSLSIYLEYVDSYGQIRKTQLRSDTSALFPFRYHTEFLKSDGVIIYGRALAEKDLMRLVQEYSFIKDPFLIDVSKENNVFEFLNLYALLIFNALFEYNYQKLREELVNFVHDSVGFALIILKYFKFNFKADEHYSYGHYFKNLRNFISCVTLLKLLASQKNPWRSILKFDEGAIIDFIENKKLIKKITDNKATDLQTLGEAALKAATEILQISAEIID